METDEVQAFCHHFDPASPIWNDQYHEVQHHVCEHCPMLHAEAHGGFWLPTRYGDVKTAATDWRIFSSAAGTHLMVDPDDPDSHRRLIPLDLDPPRQREFRALLDPYFSKRVMSGLVVDFRETADALIDDFVEHGSCDAVVEFSAAFASITFFRFLMHAPLDELPLVMRIVEQAESSDDPAVAEAAFGELYEWLRAFVRERATQPRQDDFVDAVLFGEIDGHLISESDQLATIMPITIGGLDTTSTVIAFGIAWLAEHPETQAELRADSELLSGAIEEFLRLGSPTSLVRTVVCNTELGGQALVTGERVLLTFAAANRDPEEFDAPDAFDARRDPNRHLTFGAGPHRCLGSNTARLSIRLAFEAVLERLHDLRLAPGSALRYRTAQLRSARALPIAFTPGARRVGFGGGPR